MAAVQIVGGGLSGILVAARLVHAGVPVHLHENHSSNASQVAAGLYNVYTGKALRRTWQAGNLLAELDALFQLPWMAPMAGFRHPVDLYRPYPDAFTANTWAAQSAEPGYEDLKLVSIPWRPEILQNPLGGVLVQGLGWVDVPGLLAALQRQLQPTGLFEFGNGPFDYASVRPDNATHYIFCEGVGVQANQYRLFKNIQPLKGELIRVRLPGLALDRVVMAGVYVIPQGDDFYVVGATYDKSVQDALPTQAGLDYLLRRLHILFPTILPEVITHQAALRPTSADRKPVLGRHQLHANLWFLNGLGTKGVLYSPWCSRLLAEAVLTGNPSNIPAELSLARKALAL